MSDNILWLTATITQLFMQNGRAIIMLSIFNAVLVSSSEITQRHKYILNHIGKTPPLGSPKKSEILSNLKARQVGMWYCLCFCALCIALVLCGRGAKLLHIQPLIYYTSVLPIDCYCHISGNLVTDTKTYMYPNNSPYGLNPGSLVLLQNTNGVGVHN